MGHLVIFNHESAAGTAKVVVEPFYIVLAKISSGLSFGRYR